MSKSTRGRGRGAKAKAAQPTLEEENNITAIEQSLINTKSEVVDIERRQDETPQQQEQEQAPKNQEQQQQQESNIQEDQDKLDELVDEKEQVRRLIESSSIRTVKKAGKQQEEVAEDYDDMSTDDDEDDEDDEDEEDDDENDENSENKDDNDNKKSKKSNKKKDDSEKLRRRLPMSVKELIDYHSSNGKSIKDIVNKINQVCTPDEQVSYGYVQKYLYRKKLEATTAKKARYYRKKYGFVYRRMRRKPVLTENHRASRIQWCESHIGDNFNKDIFIGKTALKPFLASLNQLKGQPADPTQPRQQTTLHLWGAISRKGASPLQIFDGALTTAMYLEILLENVVPFIAENFPDGHRFHQDNNPKHSAKLSQEFLESTGINWVKSPPRSHDLNPIELVWTDLIQVVAKRLPKTIGQVVIAVKEYWTTLTPEKCSEFIDKLVDIVPKVLEKKANGYPFRDLLNINIYISNNNSNYNA